MLGEGGVRYTSIDLWPLTLVKKPIRSECPLRLASAEKIRAIVELHQTR